MVTPAPAFSKTETPQALQFLPALGKLRDEFLNGEIFYSLKEAQILMERWRVEYNTERPHSALGYRPPAPQANLAVTSFALDDYLRHCRVFAEFSSSGANESMHFEGSGDRQFQSDGQLVSKRSPGWKLKSGVSQLLGIVYSTENGPDSVRSER